MVSEFKVKARPIFTLSCQAERKFIFLLQFYSIQALSQCIGWCPPKLRGTIRFPQPADSNAKLTQNRTDSLISCLKVGFLGRWRRKFHEGMGFQSRKGRWTNKMKVLACAGNTMIAFLMILHRASILCGKMSRVEQRAWSLGSLESSCFCCFSADWTKMK